ncbi:MAG TPA: hypothetical protein VHO25_17900 [Polyangiaceae bacterium]|nr:hypothetical protein [Polyangiaceae bacterium]
MRLGFLRPWSAVVLGGAALLGLVGFVACSEQEDGSSPYSGGFVGGGGAGTNDPDAGDEGPAAPLTDAALSALAVDAASDAGAHALCDAYATHIVDECPNLEPAEARASCAAELQEWSVVGCRTEYLVRTHCQLTAEVACATGSPVGCDEVPTFDECHQALIDTTDCARFPFLDDSCSSGEFGFLCVSQVPSGCSVVSEEGTSSNTCCPPFAD